MSTGTVTPLRHRMIEDMNARKLCAGTQRGHIHGCKRFAAFLNRSPDTATTEDIRRFQLHLAEAGVSICNRNRIMTGLRFLFRVTLRRLDLAAEIYHIREPQKIPLVMSPDETRRLLAVASNLKVRTLLSLGYGCGLRASEVVRLKVKHIDSTQKIIRVEQSKGRKSPPRRRPGSAMSRCRRRPSVCCANSGRRAHRVTIPQSPCRNAGCFPATSAASR
jgi:integrase/recombinase XerD